jgi:hypothetical protein
MFDFLKRGRLDKTRASHRANGGGGGHAVS